ncbi:MAG: hypothetical protein ACQGVK_19850 [Myxococcota bacterium]
MAESESGNGERRRRERKDRLIQTRVPRDLESTLKEEARRQRLTVSHLIRNILEDTFHLVDGVVTGVDQIVSDSVELARSVGREARRRSEPQAPGSPAPDAPGADDELAHVVAWSEVVVHRAVTCSQCGTPIARGERGFTGVSDAPGARRAWLCARCIESLDAS